MPSPMDIANLAAQLHESNLVNLSAPASDFLSAEGLQRVNPAEVAGWYVVGGDHYVVVCGASGPGDQVVSPAVG